MYNEVVNNSEARAAMPETAPTRILVVEDERMVAEVLERYLRAERYEVMVVSDGQKALAVWREWQPHLIVLDLMLPGVDGRDVCRRIRSEDQVPIVMLTAKGEESDRIVGLELGADDYVVKPFSPREVLARIKAVLRRTSRVTTDAPDGVLAFDNLRIDQRTRIVTTNSGEVHLTGKEFDLVHFLASSPGQVFTREQLMDKVWDYSYAADPSTVTVHIRRLREKLEADPTKPRYLKTVWGVGYKFEA
jgi:DNA-binding response OmpR family regulator